MKESARISILILLLIASFSNISFAGKISGQITDETNQPLPYVIVFIAGTSTGTTANSEGLYTLDLPNGSYELSYRMIGYKLLTKKVTISNTPLILDIQMVSESLQLKEVTIHANAEDPAYAIIRNAQKKRKFYRDQVKTYSADAYVKSTQRLVSYPKKLLGQNINIEEQIDTVTKIFYLSESVSEIFFKKPDNFKEKMISSKVSGEPQTYSFNQATDVLVSFYDNLIDIGGLTPRGIVSPIEGNSIFYYKFRLDGTFYENGVLVNKIAVIPKRVSDPVFTGFIYITEDTWRIYSVDLYITRNQQMEIIDTFRIKQNFIKVDEETWMPFSHQFDYSFNVLGFKGSGIVMGVFSNYNLKPEFGPGFFNAEIMKVDETANKKDSSYWESVRPVPLTNLEVTDYHRKDSVRVIHESKSYLDSIDRKDNKFSAGDLLTGYSWNNSYKKTSFSITMPLQKTFFNTVEGWNTGLGFYYRQNLNKEETKYYSFSPVVRYGFSNSHYNGHLPFKYKYNTHNNSTLILDCGTDLVQFNSNEPISEIINTGYSILAEKNYMKVYEKNYFLASHSSELFNGFGLKLGAEYARRNSLSNSSDYTIVDVEGREYTSNDPENPTTDSMRFSTNNAFTVDATVSVKPGQKYIDRPEGKYNIPSKYPVFSVTYRKGINSLGSDIDYDEILASAYDDMKLGLIGTLKYRVNAGDFLSSKSVYFPDLKHFNGNKTFLSSFNLEEYKNLDYYKYSTTGKFIEIHAEQNFGGFFLNKIPLIRKIKLQEIAGVHYLHTDDLNSYVDLSIGVEKLGLFRVELFTTFVNGEKGTVGFLFGIKQQIGR